MRTPLAVCVGILTACAAWAEPGGAIAGRVAEETGGALPGVTIEVRGAGLSTARGAETDRAGSYTVANLPAGAYEVSFRLPGFTPVSRRDVAVQPGANGSLDVVLHLAVTADVVVTARKSFRNSAQIGDAGESLLGVASAASQGSVSGRQIDARPTLRPGEVLETVPGLVISQHSGEGKADQYYLRGFDLDHGTDFATTVAGIPVNMPSHAHGQGYSDVNFVIPELVSGVRYRKGPYSADSGDFSAAGSASIDYVDSLERGIARVGGGPEGYGRVLFAQSPKLGDGTLLYALEVAHDDGPWVHPDNARKYNGVLRYSADSPEGAVSVTAMGYQSRWNSTDQIARRAIATGAISRFGALDATDGGDTHRYSLSADWVHSSGDSVTRATAYALDSKLNLFSDFTYFLDDPVHGDQFEQVDRRVVTGLQASRTWRSSLFGRETESTVGVQLRNDNIVEDGLFHTRERQVLDTVADDHVLQTSASLYYENSHRWSDTLRTVVGIRGDYYRFHVRSSDPVNSGDDHDALLSPKFSAILGPWASSELYVNYGWGFHSNDARGATIALDPKTRQPVDRVTPLVRAEGAEIGLRTVLVPGLRTTVSLWGLRMGSELVFAGDTGTTQPSRPSLRTGVEVANSWSPLRNLVVDADLALSRARFRDSGPAGDRIPGSVESVASAGITAQDVFGFFGSLRLRYFGPRPLIEDDSARSKSSTLVNAQIGYEIARGVRLVADVFNVLNARVSDVDYFYASRLPGEPAGGVADIHSHPAEPRTARVSVLYSF